MAGLKMNVEFPTRLCEVSGVMLLTQVCFVVDTLLVRLDRSMALLNSKMVFAVLTLFLLSSAMRRMPLSVHL